MLCQPIVVAPHMHLCIRASLTLHGGRLRLAEAKCELVPVARVGREVLMMIMILMMMRMVMMIMMLMVMVMIMLMMVILIKVMMLMMLSVMLMMTVCI